MTQQLIVAQTFIRQDNQGRYCLNDCHRASGSDLNKRPQMWLRNDQTKELVEELTDAQICASPISIVKGGLEQGTYVVKELVYAYAMWISPSFNLQVIRAYDDLVSQPRFQIPQTLSDALRLAADQAEEISILKPKADGLDLLTDANGSMCFTDAAKSLKVKRSELIEYLNNNKWIYKRKAKDNWIAYQDKIEQGLMWHQITEDTRSGKLKIYTQALITPKGLAKLATIFVREIA
ncbi:phage antirepressor KilAC domain-containing protein [Commensalibacter nepenthis]|uniref:Phage antirepressor KilAC domain-containing protein n=1 Tax=Commensalibacter nepenthis TaxID=3043872 RepID=A0ABT6Q8D9_9PROT|nr:phage antirepressor KilAC domain-containing protein [Commensalibacter sp. TBRC 10068]MDI2113054.1 phage antirepressor KilAC domain-containing protein [Commensalibacter sp. TBRC 10068]